MPRRSVWQITLILLTPSECFRNTMNSYIKTHKIHGEILYLENEDIRIGVALEFGLRISYLSYKGSDNLFFEQPNDMTDLTTPDGWRVRGGHRLWTAPEGEQCYHPDNDRITYQLFDNGVSIFQTKDPRINMEKTMHITFLGNSRVKIMHEIKNLSNEKCRVALWPITAVDGGGVEEICLNKQKSGCLPTNVIATWSYTSLGDERAEFTSEKITLRHKPTSKLFKIGVGRLSAPVKYTNKGVVFTKSFDFFPEKEYTDGNVSYETYMCDHMAELESLSPLYDILPGEVRSHSEIWELKSEGE